MGTLSVLLLFSFEVVVVVVVVVEVVVVVVVGGVANIPEPTPDFLFSSILFRLTI
jgi:hypothetical protein